MARLSREQLGRVKRTVAGTYFLWVHGHEIRATVSKGTFHRHRLELLEFGIDIGKPFVDDGTTDERAPDDGRIPVHLVRVCSDELPGMQNFALHEHGETYLGKDCRVAGMANAAHLATAEDAEAFAAARREHMKQLYGPGTQTTAEVIRIVRGTERQQRVLAERIRLDTERVRARLRSGQFAPNVAPPPLADEAD